VCPEVCPETRMLKKTKTIGDIKKNPYHTPPSF
jgi:hypothetical protein